MLNTDPRPHDSAALFDAAAEANHRIANHLGIITALVRLQSERLKRMTAPLDPREAALSLAGFGARIEAIARLHKQLARPQDDESVELGPYLHDFVQSAVESLSAPGTTDLRLSIDTSCRIDPKRALNVALIACEVVTNAIKYAHPSGVGGSLAVSCRRDGNVLVLEIEDDGVGFPADFDPAHSGHGGFRVIRSLVADLEADMQFRSDDLGVTFTLRVPLSDKRGANGSGGHTGTRP